ncbi:MAG: hypothetical protein ACLFPW_03985 [Spirochaetaceae bacterium]
MNRLTLPAVLLIFVSATLPAAEPEDFYNVVAYDATLKSLTITIEEEGPDALDTERIHLLDGLVSEVTIIDPNPESFLAELILVNGEWQGLEEVEMYQAYVYLEGPEFAERVPERLPREPTEEMILPNQRLLVAAQIVDVYYDEQDRGFPVAMGFHVRKLP